MNKRVATITLNPAYDLVGYADHLQYGNTNLVNTISVHAGGKGINVARILKELGMDVTVFGFLGKQNQDGFQNLFKRTGIINHFHIIEGHTRINVKLTTQNGELTEINFSGLKITKKEWEHFTDESLTFLSQFDMLCISGSLPNGVTLSAFTDWMIQLHKYCPFIVFDSSRDALVAGLKAKPSLIKPNKYELEIWAGRNLPTLSDIITTACALLQQGIENIVVSLGEEGAVWVNSHEVWIAKPPYCNVVSTAGAGDSMVGGLMYGILMEKSTEYTLRLATAIAALAVNQSSVGITDLTELYKMMGRVNLYPYSVQKAGAIS
ncbi:1-phosphofructokinase [Candidatus Erwinia haradaeae]|uniref:Phosphofructokinase n=1 Tax=Candidatus Erwinia haradaeae TaxID=1922217 RepID=A0A451D2G1_9GAMM|nr:1-phosphofructokinase [Candidatus Erwinia haradaeae]VFP79828.1 1-phosphofructokinase [Candidatus Erwinia haradaeae]